MRLIHKSIHQFNDFIDRVDNNNKILYIVSINVNETIINEKVLEIISDDEILINKVNKIFNERKFVDNKTIRVIKGKNRIVAIYIDRNYSVDELVNNEINNIIKDIFAFINVYDFDINFISLFKEKKFNNLVLDKLKNLKINKNIYIFNENI